MGSEQASVIGYFTFGKNSEYLCLVFMPFLQCGVADGEGFLSIWQVNQTASNPKPYMVSATHISRVNVDTILLVKCLLSTVDLSSHSVGNDSST